MQAPSPLNITRQGGDTHSVAADVTAIAAGVDAAVSYATAAASAALTAARDASQLSGQFPESAAPPISAANFQNLLSMLAAAGISPGTTNSSSALPVVSAGSAQTLTLPFSSVLLSGTDSNAASQQWSQAAGNPTQLTFDTPTALSTHASGTFAVGQYNFTLTATSSGGQASTSNVVISVQAAPANDTSRTAINWNKDAAFDFSQPNSTSFNGGAYGYGGLNASYKLPAGINGEIDFDLTTKGAAKLVLGTSQAVHTSMNDADVIAVGQNPSSGKLETRYNDASGNKYGGTSSEIAVGASVKVGIVATDTQLQGRYSTDNRATWTYLEAKTREANKDYYPGLFADYQPAVNTNVTAVNFVAYTPS